jgi:hypothetical protein
MRVLSRSETTEEGCQFDQYIKFRRGNQNLDRMAVWSVYKIDVLKEFLYKIDVFQRVLYSTCNIYLIKFYLE